ncbi:MAG: acyl-CoA dehydrogenase [Burkholderiaceae bacterium]
MELDSLLNGAPAETALRSLIERGWGQLPYPGAGHTLDRWRVFSAVAQRDLAWAKLLESHADALAILRELGHAESATSNELWATWCAEPSDARLEFRRAGDRSESVRLHGLKAWCSGANIVTQALVSGWNEAGQPCLVAVPMAQTGVRVTRDGWQAVGMAATASVNVVFEGACGMPVGPPGGYVKRAGFMHGAAGVAACWYGAATAIAVEVRRFLQGRREDPHALAHLGALDVALTQAADQLRLTAAEIDARPGDSCLQAVRRTRLSVETAVETVLTRAPRALGAAPLCKNARLARLLADLPVYIRQSHAERDLELHGRSILNGIEKSAWML